MTTTQTGALDPTADVDPADVLAHASLAAGNDPQVADEPQDSVLDRLEARRAEMRAKGVYLLCPIPSWGVELVGKFTKMDKATAKRFSGASEEHPHGMSKEWQGRRTMCLRIAFQCRELQFLDEVVEGDTLISGFTHEFGEKLGKPAGGLKAMEGGNRSPDVADIVWAAVDRDDENLIALTRELVKWSKNPVFKDLSDADPFGGF